MPNGANLQKSNLKSTRPLNNIITFSNWKVNKPLASSINFLAELVFYCDSYMKGKER